MKLIKPSIEYSKGYLENLKEYQALGENLDIDFTYRTNHMDEYIQSLIDSSEGKGLDAGLVPYTIFWAIVDGEYVGRISVRHYLNENLEKVGGHIGYDVRPSKRGLGYGSEMLRLVLPEARGLGIEKALLTCDSDNLASRKIIEKNGGVFEDEVEAGEGKPNKLRFWIELNSL